MVRKRVHKLRYKEVTSSGGYWNEVGDWVDGETTETVVTISCRADVNTAGRTVPNHQGQDFVYSYEIFLDKMPNSLKKGLEVEILKGDKVVLTGSVIMPFEYQTHCRIWV
ncbi:hypothetical protein [Sphingobacterium multivorum]|uniref:hypothetical protein n=1 Tax=Sphingobacterium multivorum TaxID=28454 RepID=UPI0036854875